MKIAEKIEAIRVSRKLPEKEMAKILGISQQVYNKYKNGITKKVSFEVIELAKKHLGLVVEEGDNNVTTNAVDIGELLGVHEERLIRLEGLMEALLPHVAAAISVDKFELISNLALIHRQATDFSNRIYDERKRKLKNSFS